MKKLNRKGFTLVELLAVIIILAIVVGISIPAITSIINGSKNSSLEVAVNSAADYLRDQFDVYNLDSNLADKAFKDALTGEYNAVTFGTGATVSSATNGELFTAMGFDPAKITTATVCITSTGKVYLEVTEIPTSSDYYSTEYWDGNGKATKDKKPSNKYTGTYSATATTDADGKVTCS